MSNEAWERAKCIVYELRIIDKLDWLLVDKLEGYIGEALDEAWLKGYQCAKKESVGA